MEQLKVYAILEKKKDLFFSNEKYSEEEIEEALMAAPDAFDGALNTMKFFSPNTTDLLAKITIGGDRLYLGDFKGAFLKIITVGGLFVWYTKEKKNAKSRCRALNCEILLDNIRSYRK